jgi:hypothetical protein
VELALASSRPGLHAQVYCALQISYFKAKHAFFRFTWDDIQDDSAFVLSRYFNGCTFEPHTISKHEYYPHTGYVFVSERKAPLTVDAIRKIVNRAGREAGIASRFTRICCATPPDTNWQTTGRIRGRSNSTSRTATSRTPPVIPNWRRTGSKTSGVIDPLAQ